MRVLSWLSVAVMSLVFSVVARDATQLRADIASILPSGKQGRFAYIKGGTPQAFPPGASSTVIYGVSSTDGVIRKIYPASGSGAYNCVNFSADGTRIVVYEGNADKVYVISWDGTLVRSFNAGGQLLDYWINPSDNTEWAVVMSNGISRININNPTAAAVQMVSVNPGDDGALVSDDGTKMVMYNSGNIGLRSVLPATGFTGAGTGGCWPQMRAGSPIMFSENNSDHTAPKLYNASAGSAGTIATTSALRTWINQDAANRSLSGCSDGETQYASDGHRWSRDRDFLSFYCNGAKVNPILWRVSDSKFIHIEDNLTCTYCGDMDAVFGTWSATGARTDNYLPQKAVLPSGNVRATYSISGRLISAPRQGTAVRGVAISKLANGAIAKVVR